METSFTAVEVFALLGLGLVFGLKHAMEVDHVVAVSAIVSEHRNVWRSALVGGLWGVGHTVSLFIVGMLVLIFRVAIPLPVANWLELAVALMIIALGVLALARVLRNRSDAHLHLHLHRHVHDGQSHAHLHFHEPETQHAGEHASAPRADSLPSSHSHAIARIGFKPLLVGAMHGLAGSAALTLLLLTQVKSIFFGLLYLAIFGIGSTLGMLLMSGLIGLPFALSGRRLTNLNYGLQMTAGGVSIAFGLWYAYDTVIASGLWQTII
jgi:ABC-type nickel/cobalt efflux system permease component RcnA